MVAEPSGEVCWMVVERGLVMWLGCEEDSFLCLEALGVEAVRSCLAWVAAMGLVFQALVD